MKTAAEVAGLARAPSVPCVVGAGAGAVGAWGHGHMMVSSGGADGARGAGGSRGAGAGGVGE